MAIDIFHLFCRLLGCFLLIPATGFLWIGMGILTGEYTFVEREGLILKNNVWYIRKWKELI